MIQKYGGIYILAFAAMAFVAFVSHGSLTITNWTILDSIYARARVNVNLELSRSGNGVRNGFRRPDGRGSGQFAESALDTLYVACNC